MLPDGDLLVIIRDVMLMRLDWDSNVKWETRARFHHDIALDQADNIYSLSSHPAWVLHRSEPIPILDDYLTILSPRGDLKRQLSFFEALEHEIPSPNLDAILYHIVQPGQLKGIVEPQPTDDNLLAHDSIYDVLHINSLQVIDRDVSGLCKKGDILFCSKMLNLIGVVNLQAEKLVWGWGADQLDKPHHPTLLENGNILLFDNGTNRKYSRVVELHPPTGEIVWQYQGPEPDGFFSSWGGACQRLPNGNTLITDSSRARIFEVTKEGELVWEFFNPLKARNGRRATVYRMTRIVDLENYPMLQALK
jgi:hypothetical protein